MKYLFERAEKTINDLKAFIYREKIEINDIFIKEGFYLKPEDAENEERFKWRPYKRGDFWGERDKNFWFKTIITIPKGWEDENLALTFSTGKKGWDAINPQFLVFINLKPRAGLDVNHQELLLREERGELRLDLQAYSGTFSDMEREINNKLFINLVVIDKDVEELYYNLLTPFGILKMLDKNEKTYIDTLNVLNETINLIDFRSPSKLNKSVKIANDFILKKYYEELKDDSKVFATIVGHTHIDVAWWWTVSQTRQKVSRSFASVLEFMKHYPDFHFLSSSPQLYKFIEEDQGELFREIKERVREGRWECEGAMWLEADTNIPSGESLVRQILKGKQYFKRKFKKDNYILWLPDVFGYTASLPQILLKSGIKYFMTTKIAWNQYNKLPMDTFLWEGIDGSKVLTHCITTTDPNWDGKSHFTTYNGDLTAESVIGAWRRYQNKELSSDVLISYGFGDGGGGPTKDMLEKAKRLERGLRGAPKVLKRSALDFFKDLEKSALSNKRLKKWVGELYLEYHRGTYTSISRNKKANRKNEFLYQDLEFFSMLSRDEGLSFPLKHLEEQWEILLRNQFHDILPGTSIKEVYDLTKVEYEHMQKLGEELIKDRLEFLAKKWGSQNSIFVWNTTSFLRVDVLDGLSLSDEFTHLKDRDGNLFALQKTYDGKYLSLIRDIPPYGYRELFPVKALEELENTIKITKEEIENAYIKITLDERANIISIYDREEERELVAEESKANLLRAFEDRPMYYDNWDIDEFYSEKSYLVDNLKSIEILERGPIRAVLKIEREFESSLIEQKIIIYSHSKRIDFQTFIDWRESQVLLKAEFPLSLHTREAYFDIQYGFIKRATHKNTTWDEARFEVCGHKWASLIEGSYGAALLNDSKYGWSVNDNVLSLTLLKSGILPFKEADKEKHTFTYSFLPFKGEIKNSSLIEESYFLNKPLYHVFSFNGERKHKFSHLVNISSRNVILDTVKKAEESEDYIFRFFQSSGERVKVEIKINLDLKQYILTNLLEEDEEVLKLKNNVLILTFKPYEIKTIKGVLK